MDNNGNTGSPRDMMRDRNRRGDRQSRFSDASGGGGKGDRDRSERRGPTSRIYVSNIPYETRWQDLKDLCRNMVGEVTFVELFHDESNKPRGCGIVEFQSADSVALALEKLNRADLNGRQIVVKEDYGDERDEYGQVVRRGGGGGGGGGSGSISNSNRGGGFRDRDDDRPRIFSSGGLGGSGGGLGTSGGGGGGGGMPTSDYDSPYNTYGLSTSFLQGLGIDGPLYNKVFVANLDYKVDAKKLKQVFKLAGRIVSVELSLDKDGNSRGFAVVEYDHPVEAVQAISMLDRQVLFDRRMSVRMDRIPDKGEGVKLPDGLMGIGIGLGQNGEPLRNVSYNLRNTNSSNANNNNHNSSLASGSTPINGGGAVVANPSAAAAAAASLLGPVPNNQLSGLSSNLAALSSVVNFSNLSGALSNPLINQNLSSLGLSALANSAGSGGGGGGGGDSGNNHQGNSLGGSGYNSNQGYQNAYSTPAFNSNLSLGRNRNNDFTLGGNQGIGAVRNYNTQSDDYGNRGGNVPSNLFSNNSGPSNAHKSDTIVIKNLPGTWNWQMLRDKFRDVGEVKYAEMRGHDTGMVRFSDEKAAELAIKLMDGARFDNQTVHVSFF